MTEKIVYNGTNYTRIVSGDVALGESLAASALSVDTLTVTVVSDTAPVFSYAGAVEYYRDTSLVGKFYLKSIQRVGKTQYTFTAVSAIGLLDSITHYGGIYNGQGSICTVSDIIDDIVRGVFTYTLDQSLDDILLYGYLPVDTGRDNLRQVLFAVGASITKDANGDVVFSALPSAVAHTVPASRTFTGGKVEYPTPATAVTVTEHSYAPSDDDAKELYYGDVVAFSIVSPKGESLTGQIITFKEPHHSYTCEGAAILESDVNYVVLSPTAAARLYGKAYSHSTKEFQMAAETPGNTEYIPKCSDCTLVSLANSRNVAKRMLAYYGSKMDVTQDIAVSGEKTGDRVNFVTPFGDSASGYIKQMSLSMGKLLRGSVKLDTGYIPTGFGNFYDSYDIVSQDGSYTVPAGVDQIRLVLIGGGQGGAAGEDGDDGNTPDQVEYVPNSTRRYCWDSNDHGDITLYAGDATIRTWYKKAAVNYVSGVWEHTEPVQMTLDEALSLNYKWLYHNNAYYALGNAGGNKYIFDKRVITTIRPSNEYRALYSVLTEGGKGGSGGKGGEGGRIHQVDLAVEPGTAIAVTVGQGGTAGAYGTETVAVIDDDTFSSLSGERKKAGIVNVLTGTVYGSEGSKGTDGADGGASSGINVWENGGGVGGHPGGTKGILSGNESIYIGGSGGGASRISDGGNGADAVTRYSASSSQGGTSGDGGAGADGGTPSQETVYGKGGVGGDGGGGGGNAGAYIDSCTVSSSVILGAAGSGGAGGGGGKGADGCVIIFYSSAQNS